MITKRKLNRATKQCAKAMLALSDEERDEMIQSELFLGLLVNLPAASAHAIGATLEMGLLVGQKLAEDQMAVDDHCPECGEFEAECTC